MQTNPKREQLTTSYDWYRQMRETQPVFFDPKQIPSDLILGFTDLVPANW